MGTAIAFQTRMEMVSVLDRCRGIETAIGEIYGQLAARFAGDPELEAFWNGLARDEREHAHKLGVWKELLVRTPRERHPVAEGFDRDLPELEKLVRESRNRVSRVTTPDDAFAIALALEMSELDVIYTTLIQSSPLHRSPDLEQTQRQELGRHHEALVAMIRARSRDEKNLYDAELIATHA